MILSKTDKQIYIYKTLRDLFPNPETELNYDTPFQLLIAVLMSAQTTDIQVNKVTDKFFSFIKTPLDLIKRGEDKLTKSIAGVNYAPTKARHIWATCHMLVDEIFFEQSNIQHQLSKDLRENQQYFIPDSVQTMTQLPGVGTKTAKVVGAILFDLKVIAVDTHVHRVANRLGLCNTKTPENTSQKLEKIYKKDNMHDIHHMMILFGRYTCTARKPHCTTCPLQKICIWYKKNNKTKTQE